MVEAHWRSAIHSAGAKVPTSPTKPVNPTAKIRTVEHDDTKASIGTQQSGR